jgi:hypothetical protein
LLRFFNQEIKPNARGQGRLIQPYFGTVFFTGGEFRRFFYRAAGKPAAALSISQQVFK